MARARILQHVVSSGLVEMIISPVLPGGAEAALLPGLDMRD